MYFTRKFGTVDLRNISEKKMEKDFFLRLLVVTFVFWLLGPLANAACAILQQPPRVSSHCGVARDKRAVTKYARAVGYRWVASMFAAVHFAIEFWFRRSDGDAVRQQRWGGPSDRNHRRALQCTVGRWRSRGSAASSL